MEGLAPTISATMPMFKAVDVSSPIPKFNVASISALNRGPSNKLLGGKEAAKRRNQEMIGDFTKTAADNHRSKAAAAAAEADAKGSATSRWRSKARRLVHLPAALPFPGFTGRSLFGEDGERVLDRFLKNVAVDHPATARHSKIVLTGIIGLAVRHDALHSNPIRDVGPIKLAAKNVKALSVKDVQKLRTIIGDWQNDPDHQGRPRAGDLLDVLDIFLGTGARIGEVLAIRWKDIDLQAKPPTVTISGTVVMEKGRSAYRQDHPKTKAGFRTMKLPPFAARTLERKYAAEQPKSENMLFPSSTGSVRSPHNFRRQWRDARARSAYEWVTLTCSESQ
jgi:integrase